MNRRDLLRGGLGVGIIALAGCTVGNGRQLGLSEGFEADVDWETGAHIGPEEPLSAFEWTVEPSDERAATGDRSLRVFTEGDHDDGTAWAVHPVSAPDGRSRARVTAQFWSESESFNVLRHAVVRLAPGRPETESDFPDPGQNSSVVDDAPYGGLREPLHLAAGWREYACEWIVPAGVTDLHVAVGVSVIWETDATHFVDDVRVTFEEL